MHISPLNAANNCAISILISKTMNGSDLTKKEKTKLSSILAKRIAAYHRGRALIDHVGVGSYWPTT